jgi:hypothetical protein
MLRRYCLFIGIHNARFTCVTKTATTFTETTKGAGYIESTRFNAPCINRSVLTIARVVALPLLVIF